MTLTAELLIAILLIAAGLTGIVGFALILWLRPERLHPEEPQRPWFLDDADWRW